LTNLGCISFDIETICDRLTAGLISEGTYNQLHVFPMLVKTVQNPDLILKYTGIYIVPSLSTALSIVATYILVYIVGT
jgi:hypothetical protein